MKLLLVCILLVPFSLASFIPKLNFSSKLNLKFVFPSPGPTPAPSPRMQVAVAPSYEELKQRVLDITAQSIPFSVEACAKLFKEIILYPDLLDLALKTIEDPECTRYFLLTPSEAQLVATGNGLWLCERYMLNMTTFNFEEFSAKVTFSFEAVKFLVRMKLNRPCHLEAFLHLLCDPQADFSNPTDWNSNMLLICARSVAPEFWSFFLQHARNLPPLRMNHEFITNQVYLPTQKLDFLVPRLGLIDYFIFGSSEAWKVLSPYFRALDISHPVGINFVQLLPNPAIADLFPQKLKRIISWPILHLTVVLDNFNAFKAVLAHPKFRSKMLTETVSGFTLEDLFSLFDQQAVRSKMGSIGSSAEFKNYLEEYTKSQSVCLMN